MTTPTLPRSLYSVDTSALLDGLERYYPQATFPGLWERVDSLIGEARFIVSDEVWVEARARDQTAKHWCDARDRSQIVVPTDNVIAQEVRAILANYPKLVGNQKGRNRADPFVIAVAKIRGATVVTGEGGDGNANRPKIPYICGEMRIPCVRFLDLVKNEGWTFS